MPENRHKTGFRGPSPDVGKATRWKKGIPSPNPGGRPRSKTVSAAYRKRLEEDAPEDRQGRTFAEIVADAQIRKAIKGNTAAAKEVTDRTEGKPQQSLEIGRIPQVMTFLIDRATRPPRAPAAKQYPTTASSQQPFSSELRNTSETR